MTSVQAKKSSLSKKNQAGTLAKQGVVKRSKGTCYAGVRWSNDQAGIRHGVKDTVAESLELSGARNEKIGGGTISVFQGG